MNVAKMLKMKNRMAGEITRLKNVLVENNCSPEGRKPDYDTRSILSDIEDRIEDICRIKTAIAVCNSQVVNGVCVSADIRNTQWFRVFMCAELKGLIGILKDVPAKEGKFKEGFDETHVISYSSTFSRVALDCKIKELEIDIVDYQDQMDDFNATTKYDVIVTWLTH